MDTEKTKVVFRKWKNGGIMALFPDSPWSPLYCTAYEHVGQHGGADYSGCIRTSRPATPEEYKALAAELAGLGYNLDIRLRKA